MTSIRIAPTPLPNMGGDTSVDSLRNMAATDNASFNQQTGYSRAGPQSNNIAQAFPTPGSIFGRPSPIPKPRTDAIIIGSFDPKVFLRPGGAAGFLNRYVFAPSASHVTNTSAVSNDTTNSLDGIVDALKAQKRLNQGQALSRIAIVTHGGSGQIQFGNGVIRDVDALVDPIMAKGLLKPGGRLVLGGCAIASGPDGLLKGLAKKYNILIQASEVMTAFGSENLAYKTFHPNGKVTRHIGPFAPF